MVIITTTQLRAIKAKVTGVMEEQHALQERKALHARSREMTSMWPDALQARRKRKQSKREQKLAKEEAVRAELDQQDAADKEHARLKKLHEAADKLLQQTDEMKTLARSQLLADVARQRQDQLDEHQKRRTAESKTHYAFLAKQEHQRQEALQQEERLAQAAKEKALELSRAREEQLEAFKARLLAERGAALQDGLKTQKQAAQYAQQETIKEEERRKKAVQAVRETDKANQALRALRMQQKEQERMYDAKIADYRAKKAAEDEQRAAALVAKAAAKEAQRRLIARVMETQFLESQTEFEARHAVAAEEARMKEDSTAAEASLRRAERATEIQRSRREQMAQKQEQAEQRAQEQRAFSEHISNVLQAVRLEQEESAVHCRARNVAHAAFLQHQIKAKQARREQSSF